MTFVNRVRRANPDFLRIGRRDLDVLEGRDFKGDEFLGVGKKFLACCRKVDLLARPRKQGHAQFLFQVSDAVRHCRLGDKKLLRRFRKVFDLAQGDESS